MTTTASLPGSGGIGVRSDGDDVRYYSLTTDQVLVELDSTQDGLTQSAAHERVKQYGPNALDTKKRKPAILRFLAHFDAILIYLLLGSAVL